MSRRPRAHRPTFTPDEDQTPGGHPVAVLSHNYWMRRFAAIPRAQPPSRERTPMTIVGVAPAGSTASLSARAPTLRADDDEGADDADLGRLQAAPFWLTSWRGSRRASRDAGGSGYNVAYRQINELELKAADQRRRAVRDRSSQAPVPAARARGPSDLRSSSRRRSSCSWAWSARAAHRLRQRREPAHRRGAARQKGVAMRLAIGRSRGAIVRGSSSRELVLLRRLRHSRARRSRGQQGRCC